MKALTASSVTGGSTRHIISGIGALLVGMGIADDNIVQTLSMHWENILGAVMFGAGLLASIRNKFDKKEEGE